MSRIGIIVDYGSDNDVRIKFAGSLADGDIAGFKRSGSIAKTSLRWA